MTGWKSSSNRKKHQRALNKVIKNINHSLLQDDLWMGRFYIKQGSYSYFYPYEDGSGWNLYVVLEMHDRLTGQKKEIGDEVNHFCMWNGSKLFWELNSFIVETCDVWRQDPRPGSPEYKELTDQMVKKGWNY